MYLFSYRLLLVKEVVSLMYLISVYDPFFDTHLKQCEYWYVFVLNRLSYLFSTAKEEEVDEGMWITNNYLCMHKAKCRRLGYFCLYNNLLVKCLRSLIFVAHNRTQC
jgi:hypothetical protein